MQILRELSVQILQVPSKHEVPPRTALILRFSHRDNEPPGSQIPSTEVPGPELDTGPQAAPALTSLPLGWNLFSPLSLSPLLC